MPLDLQRHDPAAGTRTCTEAERALLDAFADTLHAQPASLAALDATLGKARMKFPANYDQLAPLVEEVGELAEALMGNGNTGGGHADVAKEALQAAAMGLRVIEEGSAAHAYRPAGAPAQPVQPWPTWWAELERVAALLGTGAIAADDWRHHWCAGRTPAQAFVEDARYNA